MKKRVLSMILALTLLMTVFASAALAKKAKMLYVQKKAYVYEEPFTDSEILTTLPKGTPIYPEKAGKNGWYIYNVGSLYGYVRASRLGTTNPEDQPVVEKKTMYVNAVDSINLQAKRSGSSKKLASIPRGTKLTVWNLTNGWYETKYNGKQGYVYAQLLSKKKPSSPKPNPDPTADPAAKQQSVMDVFTKAKSVDYQIVVMPLREGGHLNMRYAPSKDSPVVAVYTSGAILRAMSEAEGWVQVYDEGANRTGWMASDYVAVYEESEAAPAKTEKNVLPFAVDEENEQVVTIDVPKDVINMSIKLPAGAGITKLDTAQDEEVSVYDITLGEGDKDLALTLSIAPSHDNAYEGKNLTDLTDEEGAAFVANYTDSELVSSWEIVTLDDDRTVLQLNEDGEGAEVSEFISLFKGVFFDFTWHRQDMSDLNRADYEAVCDLINRIEVSLPEAEAAA